MLLWFHSNLNKKRYLFKVDESTKFQVPQISVNKIPEEKTKFLRVDGFNPKNNNSLITNYYQLGLGSMHKYMLLEVGCQIMEEPVFDTLRTKEQLGYSVFSMLRNTHGIIGLSITVNTQVI
jgi:nardilysin